MLYDVAMNLTKLVPDTPLARAQTGVKRALESIYNQHDWSWQKEFGGWLAPGVIIDHGSFTTTPYSNQIIADATATEALQAWTGRPLITELQYRDPAFAIYDIVAYDYDTINPGFVTLTLDRPWMEPGTGPGQPFIIYQAYFVSPVPDFRKFIAIQDMTNDQPMDFWSMTRADLAAVDPQRQDDSIPINVVPAGIDRRQGSSTYGWQRFELYPWQADYCPYTLTFRRRGKLPESQSDWMTMVPEHPITENMLEFKAKEILLLDKSAEMEAKVPGSGKGMVLLSAAAQKVYNELLLQVLDIDLNLDGEQLTHTHLPGKWDTGGSQANFNKGLTLGGYPSGGGV